MFIQIYNSFFYLTEVKKKKIFSVFTNLIVFYKQSLMLQSTQVCWVMFTTVLH